MDFDPLTTVCTKRYLEDIAVLPCLLTLNLLGVESLNVEDKF